MPVQMICKRAHEEGILTIIDGAHAPGQLSLDLTSLSADFYIGNCHKWMLSPKGAGFLFVRPEHQAMIEPLFVSWGYQSKDKPPQASTFIDYLQWSGPADPSAALSVPTAIEFMKEYHWDEVRVTCHKLSRNEIERIYQGTGILPLYPLDSDFYHQMATIPIPQVKNLNHFKCRLYTDYKIEIPFIEWNNQHFLRLSVQGYNTKDDIDQLYSAVMNLIPEMEK